jgi:hypothetical protein
MSVIIVVNSAGTYKKACGDEIKCDIHIVHNSKVDVCRAAKDKVKLTL